MRVIAGKYKGRSLVAVGNATRPTLDRSKETLFNILQMRLNDCAVLDLFAGSGQLAIESLSRGAKLAVLCDNNKQAQLAIRQNFQKIEEIPNLYCGSYQDCLLAQKGKQFDVVFVDPPYQSNYYVDVLTKIDEYDILSQDGIVVCEHSCEDQLPTVVSNLAVYDQRKIGSVKFTFYQRSE